MVQKLPNAKLPKKQPKNKPPIRIGLDCRLSGSAHAGIGRYIENLLVRLPTLAPEIEWFYIFHDRNQYRHILDQTAHQWRHQLSQVTTTYAPIRHYSLAEQRQLPIILKQLELDVLHVPNFNIPIWYSGPLVVTIHDLLWHEYQGTQVTTLPAWKYWLKYAAYRWVVSQAVSHARAIIVPTETIKQTLCRYYPHSATKLVVTKEGVDDRLTPFGSNKVTKKPQHLIYVGSLYPHKNIKIVIDALKQLPHWHLEIVGARSVFQDQIKRYVHSQQVHDRVHFLGFLPDKQLAEHIQSATALVQPSLSEGFGLTGLEAMALGTPVIASDIPIFHEIYQHAAVFFNPHSTEDFSQKLTSLSHLNLSKWTKTASALVAEYSWDKLTQQTIEVYRQSVDND